MKLDFIRDSVKGTQNDTQQQKNAHNQTSPIDLYGFPVDQRKTSHGTHIYIMI